ncbi:hypothetical protein [Aquipuribacter sp. SD81]|uniref:hypothetical protein n=1 Tax=Aquipuribacter sp. SD81 TaxID=3127703 RepID=UPI00301687C8
MPAVRPRRASTRERAVTPTRLAVALVVGIVLSGALVWQSSYAAFTATTRNENNAWSAGSVQLTTSSPSTALFNEVGLVPGSTGQRCITVTYTGVPADVRLYAQAAGATDLSPYLELTVDRGTGGDASCTGFTPSSALYGPAAPSYDPALTLATFSATHTGYANGLTGWTTTGDAQTTYRVRYRLKDDNTAQGKTTAVSLVWEAQNT